ncbi:MAG: hypothetical protein U0232_05550 [Thermomicrobiales bacterium]
MSRSPLAEAREEPKVAWIQVVRAIWSSAGRGGRGAAADPPSSSTGSARATWDGKVGEAASLRRVMARGTGQRGQALGETVVADGRRVRAGRIGGGALLSVYICR